MKGKAKKKSKVPSRALRVHKFPCILINIVKSHGLFRASAWTYVLQLSPLRSHWRLQKRLLMMLRKLFFCWPTFCTHLYSVMVSVRVCYVLCESKMKNMKHKRFSSFNTVIKNHNSIFCLLFYREFSLFRFRTFSVFTSPTTFEEKNFSSTFHFPLLTVTLWRYVPFPSSLLSHFTSFSMSGKEKPRTEKMFFHFSFLLYAF